MYNARPTRAVSSAVEHCLHTARVAGSIPAPPTRHKKPATCRVSLLRLWCQNICEKGYTGATLDMWIHRWINRYRDLPYCAREGNEEPPPQET